ncbi:MAG TPA: NRDE family protein [Tepidisphaeraceae bacterium]|nr:NRDE family protein [Tepidisphaeraceae bacterium]
MSLISTGDRLRLACNRDEQLTRPTARPPEVFTFDDYFAAMPIDPESGGTWIAVNDAGVMMCLLNRTVGRALARDPSQITRGRIIPSLIHFDSAAEAARAARRLRAELYQPFRLIIIDPSSVFEVISNSDRIKSFEHIHDLRPLMFTSSGLGDALVEGPRRALFGDLFGDGAASAARQDVFHDHRWKDMPHLSVRMSRVDARTVSITTIDLTEDRAVMEYRPIAAPLAARNHVVTIPLKAMAHS